MRLCGIKVKERLEGKENCRRKADNRPKPIRTLVRTALGRLSERRSDNRPCGERGEADKTGRGLGTCRFFIVGCFSDITKWWLSGGVEDDFFCPF